MKSNKGFDLFTVIIIICIVSISSAITVGVIVTNGYKNTIGIAYKDIANDKDLSEFLEVYSNITKNYYEDIDKEKMLDSAIDAMLKYVDDPYTTYLDEKETQQLDQRLSGTYEGIGVIIKGNEIVSITEGSPAEKAGLLPGDKILIINDIDVREYSSNAISILIRYGKEKTLNMKVLREGEELDFTLELATLTNHDVGYTIDKNKIGYINISVFSRTLDSQMEEALIDLKNENMERLILDLRDNTGGYLDIAEKVASRFLEKGKLIYSLESKDSKDDHYDETDDKLDVPIVILLNSSSASASEILAGALKDSYGAVIVGQTSYGKGKVQQTYDLSNGTKAKYTSARWLRPNGECVDGVGIKPDYEVELLYEYDEEGNTVGIVDTQLQKAVEVISTM